VLLGNGDGTFQPAITTNLPVQANSVAAGDFNRDGKLDLVLTNRSNNTVEVLRGNGDGTFQSNPLILPVGAGASSVAVGDFLHNGNLDLAVTNSGSGTVSVLLGNGDGTFQAATNVPVGTIPVSVAAIDLGNGQIDLVVANFGSNTVSVLLGNGDGAFRSGQTIAVANASNVMGGDFNGDGTPDVVIEEVPPGDAIFTSVEVLFGNGDGTLDPGPTQSLGLSRIGLAVGDFSGDGKQDIVVLNPIAGSTVEVFSGNGDGTFAAPPDVFRTGGVPFGVAAGDFNGDGRPDLALANSIGNNVGVLLNTSTVATATTLNTDVNPAAVGQLVNLTAMVSGAAGIPTGAVTFLDGDAVLGTATLDDTGTATLAVAFATAGDHALTAVYSGDGSFATSTSDVLTETVTPAPTAVVLSPSVDTGMSGAPVDFTVTVSPVMPGTGTPTGNVTLFDGATALGTAQLDANGQVVFTFALETGDHSLTVSYDGDGNFQSGMSDPLDFPVI
jgi:hypothetical protein